MGRRPCAVIAAQALAVASAQNNVMPNSFGNGLAGVNICFDSPTVVLNITLSKAGAEVGIANHFWSTGPDNLFMEYYIDGEAVPSVAFSPPMAAGQGFQSESGSDPLSPGGLYTAGGRTGKGGSVGGWYVDWDIPFYSSLSVTARLADNSTGNCAGAWIIVRGYSQPAVAPQPILTLPSGFQVPWGARMSLQKLDQVTLPPLWPVALANVSFGYSGLLLALTIATSTSPPGNNYIEGCWHLLPNGNISTGQPSWAAQSIVIGTGMEDFFNSAFWFGAASGYPNGLLFTHPGSGLTHFSRGPPQGQAGVEQLSAYRYLDRERLGWQDGGRLVWRVGDQNGKCTLGGLDNPIGTPSSATVSSYVWMYTWPNGAPIAPLPDGPTPLYMSYTCNADNQCVPVANSTGAYWTADCDSSCGKMPGPPAVVGCADGTCDAFCAETNVRGCSVTWNGTASLRTPPTGTAPGCGGLVPCPTPADACGPGWAVCGSNFSSPGLSVQGFRTAMDPTVCATKASGLYAGAVSHANPAWQPLPPQPCPASPTDGDNGCMASGWGAEPICCGTGCIVPSCPSYVWPSATRIHVGEGEGCGGVTSDYLDGVLCCRVDV